MDTKKEIWMIVVAAILSLIIASCADDDSQEESYNEDGTISISTQDEISQTEIFQNGTISISTHDNLSQSETPQNGITLKIQIPTFNGISSEARVLVSSITSILVTVKQGNTVRIQDQPLTITNGVWVGTLTNMPVGPELTFIAKAYDNVATEIFNGTTTYILQSTGDNSLMISLAAVSNKVRKFPKIEQISRPPGIPANVAKQINFYVSASYGETLTWEVTSFNGTFTPASGTITLAGSLGTVSVQYTGPAVIGVYSHDFKVTNSQGNSVKAVFDTTITDTWTTIQSELFGPCVACHNNVSDAAGKGLSFAADKYTTLVLNSKISSRGYAYIAAGRDDLSYVIQKLEGSGKVYSGARMPNNGPYYDQTKINRLKTWIKEGALSADGTKASAPNYPVNSWMYVQTKVFAVCTVCHTDVQSAFPVIDTINGGYITSAPKGVLFDPWRYSTAVNNSTIRPYEPSNSKAWQRVNETDPSKRMPWGMPALSAEQKQIMLNWINAGAPLVQ